MNPNREHKNSVFTALFKDKEALLELYNALTDSDLPPDTEIEITTLQGILFLDAMNDISFLLEGRIVLLIEHQSSISENTPLRLLLYVSRVYEKLVDKRSVYRQKLLKVPTPELIVLYNGKASFPEQKTLKLSDAFIEAPKRDGSMGSLELEVQVLNINAGYNEEILNRSENLSGYVAFIDKIREYTNEGMELGEAIALAVKHCEANNILQPFLSKHASEVENMLTTEFVMADAIEVWKEEGREEGLEEGREEGMRAVLSLLESGKTVEEIKAAIGLGLNLVEERA